MKIEEIARFLELPSLYQPTVSQATRYLASAGLENRLHAVPIGSVSELPVLLDEKQTSMMSFALRIFPGPVRFE